jgi:hypothetical protein
VSTAAANVAIHACFNILQLLSPSDLQSIEVGPDASSGVVAVGMTRRSGHPQ